jgi:predicted pyridoxine 5'-phosphate oxidase superfamily flavin-nucleotide-binding protein
MNEESPFHSGEQALQARAGVRERMERAGRISIRKFMLDQHREFFEELPWVLVSSLDSQGRPWASALVGVPGFMHSPDARALEISASIPFGDPLRANLSVGAAVGLLGIQLETRRRNRMNGTVTRLDANGFAVRVEQSFGNCPQYIQARSPELAAEPSTVANERAVAHEGAMLSTRASALIERSDTFFIASRSATLHQHGGDGVDISHRGGKPGFVRVDNDATSTVLTIPDFRGNSFFNTFGNLALDARAALLFIDFETGDVLTITGTAEVIWEGVELESFAGAERLLRFRVSEGLMIDKAVPLTWTPAQPARQLAATGSWR